MHVAIPPRLPHGRRWSCWVIACYRRHGPIRASFSFHFCNLANTANPHDYGINHHAAGDVGRRLATLRMKVKHELELDANLVGVGSGSWVSWDHSSGVSLQQAS